MPQPFKGLFKRKKRTSVANPPLALDQTPNFSDLFLQPSEAVDAELPGFRSTAGDHFSAGRSDRFAQARLKVRNAFTPSQPVANRRYFAGRRALLAEMIRAIEDQRQHLVLFGERGIGKTSLLHILSEAARQARYIVVYWSCGANSDFDETFRAASADIPLLFHSGFSPTTSEAEMGATLADLLPSGRVSPRVFGDLCAKLTGTRVLIILDEFDRAESGSFRREIAELIKILSDRAVRVELIIAGVAADVAELVEHIPSIRRNIQIFRVPLMTAGEIQELVETGAKGSGVAFTEEAGHSIAEAALGSPYLAALICHHAALAAIDGRRSSVAAEHVQAGITQAAAELKSRIPRRVQLQIERLIARDASRPLAVLASASLTAGGELDDQCIEDASRTTAEATLCKRLALELAQEGELIKLSDADGRRRFVFTEDGVPPYLWMVCAAHAQPAEERDAKRRIVG